MEGYINLDLNELDLIPVKRQRGIYFLYRGTELVYIGQTTHLLPRLGNHIDDNSKEFDFYKFLEINGNINLDSIERDYIMKYKPIYNIQFNTDIKKNKRKKTKVITFDITKKQ